MRIKLGLIVAVSMAVTGCEPLDLGGGGGIGGRLAFLRSGALVVSQDDGTGERALTDPDTAAAPALAPNGQSVAFAFSETGDDTAHGIYRVGFFPGSLIEPVALPPGGTTYRTPTWSPDGRDIVFIADAGSNTTVMRVSADGGEPSTVANAPAGCFFPSFVDSARLLLSCGTSLELRVVDLGTGDVTSVGVTSRARAAAFGERIAFARDGGGGTIVVRDLDSGEETTLLSSGQGDTKPAFSSDGEWVAFEASGRIYAVRSDGSGDIEVLQSGTDVSWGP